jgi:hypothetical protein
MLPVFHTQVQQQARIAAIVPAYLTVNRNGTEQSPFHMNYDQAL